MKNIFDEIGRFVLKLVIIFLVLLISFQIISVNEKNSFAFEKISNTLGDYLNYNKSETVYDKSKSIDVVERIRYREITIDLMQNYSLPEVWVLKNQKRIANFSEGIITIRVQEDDFISIDATDYQEVLWFEVTSLSRDIKNWSPGKQFRTKGNLIDLGIVKIYGEI